MPDYNSPSTNLYQHDGISIHSFLKSDDQNLDKKTVDSFGNEWNRFKEFDKDELTKIGDDYFDVVDLSSLSGKVCLDVGCGSGRWAKYLAPYVKFIEAMDPSSSVFSAATFLSGERNVRITQAGVNAIPFPDNSFDFVYSLGVLHHLPDTELAIQHCFEKTKPGGWFLLYLYYNLDNRTILHKILFGITNQMRKQISRLPSKFKSMVCDAIAIFIYWPLSKIASLLSLFSVKTANAFPLGYYRKTSFHIMRNDSLDRFGTPLELRFSKLEITSMLERSGFRNLTFSKKQPYWHVIAQRP